MPAERPFEVFAWIGEDEYGSGEVGLKQGYTPAGLIPLVSVDRVKLARPEIVAQMAQMATLSGKPLRLVRMVMVEEVMEVRSPAHDPSDPQHSLLHVHTFREGRSQTDLFCRKRREGCPGVARVTMFFAPDAGVNWVKCCCCQEEWCPG